MEGLIVVKAGKDVKRLWSLAVKAAKDSDRALMVAEAANAAMKKAFVNADPNKPVTREMRKAIENAEVTAAKLGVAAKKAGDAARKLPEGTLRLRRAEQ
jgi:hypothetical protein